MSRYWDSTGSLLLYGHRLAYVGSGYFTRLIFALSYRPKAKADRAGSEEAFNFRDCWCKFLLHLMRHQTLLVPYGLRWGREVTEVDVQCIWASKSAQRDWRLLNTQNVRELLKIIKKSYRSRKYFTRYLMSSMHAVDQGLVATEDPERRRALFFGKNVRSFVKNREGFARKSRWQKKDDLWTWAAIVNRDMHHTSQEESKNFFSRDDAL